MFACCALAIPNSEKNARALARVLRSASIPSRKHHILLQVDVRGRLQNLRKRFRKGKRGWAQHVRENVQQALAKLRESRHDQFGGATVQVEMEVAG